MHWGLIPAYIATTAFALYGLFFDYSTSSTFKPITDGTVKTREGNKFFRNADGSFNFKKYAWIHGVALIAVNALSIGFGELRGAIFYNGIVGAMSLFAGIRNRRLMKAAQG